MGIENTGYFKGKTILISGASRGIGKEIALKLAADGANIVIAAKTAESHPTLPGTIYTAAEQVEKAGGKCLPCVVDVRDELSVDRAVQAAVEKFGGIDVLINNASAICLTNTPDTTMKRFDLMHSVNTRGTFMLSQKCIPYLQKSSNPHILNMSPPLVMEAQWFSPHLAYSMSKIGMSMCVLGMSQEFRPLGIAVNALWPRTIIWTSALKMVASSMNINQECSRKPQIVVDAAYEILSKPSKQFTANFLIDEDFLRDSCGVTAFDEYAFDPKADLQEDFFVPKIKKREQQ